MRKKIKVFCLVSMIGIGTLFAQKGTIIGVILDSETNSEIPFANIVVSNESSSQIIKVVSSDENGKFEAVKLPKGFFTLEISFMGYETVKLNNIGLSRSVPKVDVGNIILKPTVESLNEVTVEATRKTATTKIDRKTYDTADFETAKGGNAADVLNKLPSITVDPSGNVSVRGTSDFVVYLNGKPTQIDPATLLAQISGNTIKQIDVITVPTARYDAQGKGGIINISTRNMGVEGLSIATNGLLGGAPWSNITDKYSDFGLNDDRYGGGINLVFNKKNTSLYGGFNYNKKNINGKRSGDAKVLVKNPLGDYFHMVAAGERPEWYEYYSANAGIDINLTERDRLSVSYF